MRIPILDLSPDIQEHWTEYNEAFSRVLKSTQFIGGPEVKLFESEVASYLNVKHAIGVNSGTDALVIALRASGIGPGDEVILPSFTFFATAEAVSMVGATPIFVDINPKTYNLEPNAVETKISGKTKGLLPVHLFGYPAEMGTLRSIAEKHHLRVIEDTAQAFGAETQGKKTGTLGTAGAFSFFPSKNLGCFGDGGLIVTDDDQVAETARMLGSHGSKKKYHNEILGYNSRLDAIQAALLRVKLRSVNKANESRRQAARRYHELFVGCWDIVTPMEPTEGTHVFHQYTVRIRNGRRDLIHQRLLEAGIQTMIYYPIPIHKMKPYNLSLSLPETEHACAEVISLPIGPCMKPETQAEVAEKLIALVKS